LLDDSEVEKWVDSVSSEGYLFTKRRLTDTFERINRMLPFDQVRPVPFAFPPLLRISMRGLKKLDGRTFTIPALLAVNRCRLIVQRVDDSATAVTFANAMIGIRSILRGYWPTRIRPMRSQAPALAIGSRFVVSYVVADELVDFPDLDWRSLADRMTAAEFWKIRRNAAYTFAFGAVCKEIFGGQQLWIAPTTGEFVPSLDMGSIRTPNGLAEFLGPTGRGRVAMEVAAIAAALVGALEAFRAIIEVVGGEADAEKMVMKREQVESRVLALAPPRGPAATIEDNVQWWKAVERVVEGQQEKEERREVEPERGAETEEGDGMDEVLEYYFTLDE
jgi:hypothetical protein